MDERILYAAAGVVAGALAGGGATYLFLQKKLERQYEEALDKELENTKKFYATIIKPASPEDMARERGVGLAVVETIIDEAGYGGETEEATAVEQELKEVTKNVFTNYANISTWDADAEEAKRDPSMPYVISHDEFFENEPDHIQAQLTFFAEDGVLADSEDKPVDESIVGPDNLEKFGHGSRDPNIVYIRNEGMDIDFEIMRAEGKYSEQVMGFIKHSEPAIRRFRLDDE